MEHKVKRRALIGAGLAGAASACAPCPKFSLPGAGRTPVSDSHTHLFNAADLPIHGFMRDVLVPRYASNVPEIALALADLALSVLKALSISAEAELKRRLPPWREAVAEDVPAEVYADAIADRIEAQVAARGVVAESGRDPENDLGDSYFALASLLAEATDTPRAGQQGATPVDRSALARIARDGAAAVPTAASLRISRSRNRPAPATVDAREILAILKWAWMMVQSRCAHLHAFLAFAEHDGRTEVKRVINLLVDYDKWLDDTPKAGSSHASQVAFWTRYARALSMRIDIRTFAGFDPLKHVEERLSNQMPVYFETLKKWALAGKAGGEPSHAVAGFKLYPPMGFRAAGNAGRIPYEDRAGARVRARWDGQKPDKWPITEFGDRLDASLDEFFDFCIDHDIPVLAHVSNSNEASAGSGADAGLAYWHARGVRQRQRRPNGPLLRASMGHDELSDYSPGGYREMLPKLLRLNRDKIARFYFDFSYSTQMLAGGMLAKSILDDLARLGGTLELHKYLMFGSDWIMLGQSADANAYYDNAITAIRNHGYWKDYEGSLLRDNLNAFLGLPAEAMVADRGLNPRLCPSVAGR